MTADDLPTDVVQAVDARSRGYCEVGRTGCAGRAARHRVVDLRARDAAENVLAVCKPCHEFLGGHPDLARRLVGAQ